MLFFCLSSTVATPECKQTLKLLFRFGGSGFTKKDRCQIICRRVQASNNCEVVFCDDGGLAQVNRIKV